MNDLDILLTRAKIGDQAAFGEIVRRFQDRAVGYAYAITGDRYLAEDAAQDAFVEAWRSLSKVYGAAAFPGWLRTIVFKWCDRLTRGKRVETTPLVDAAEIATDEADPCTRIEREEISEIIHVEIQRLTDLERQATLLFYMTEHSYQETAHFLGVPVRTVKSRLHTARGKLRERMIPLMQDHLSENAPSRDPSFASKVLQHVKPLSGDSTLICSLYPALKAAGWERSESYLMGILGHAFSFVMKKQGGEVWQQAEIDWALFWDRLDDLGHTFQVYDATLKGPRAISLESTNELKHTAYDAVRVGVDRGVPAIAWQPMTLEQRDTGVTAYEWGLLVGYELKSRTYTVRHPHYKATYTIPFDRFGFTDPVNWFHVIVIGDACPVDLETVAIRSLQQAVSFANGSRYNWASACYSVDAFGFSAYELWLDALQRGVADPHFAPEHSAILGWLRGHAGVYIRELSDQVRPEARSALLKAAEAYDEEVVAVNLLTEICRLAASNGGFTPSSSHAAAERLSSALEADWRAIHEIEMALNVLSGLRDSTKLITK